MEGKGCDTNHHSNPLLMAGFSSRAKDRALSQLEPSCPGSQEEVSYALAIAPCLPAGPRPYSCLAYDCAHRIGVMDLKRSLSTKTIVLNKRRTFQHC